MTAKDHAREECGYCRGCRQQYALSIRNSIKFRVKAPKGWECTAEYEDRWAYPDLERGTIAYRKGRYLAVGVWCTATEILVTSRKYRPHPKEAGEITDDGPADQWVFTADEIDAVVELVERLLDE